MQVVVADSMAVPGQMVYTTQTKEGFSVFHTDRGGERVTHSVTMMRLVLDCYL